MDHREVITNSVEVTYSTPWIKYVALFVLVLYIGVSVFQLFQNKETRRPIINWMEFLAGFGIGVMVMSALNPDTYWFMERPDPYVQRGQEDYLHGIAIVECPFTESTAVLKWHEGWEVKQNQDILARRKPKAFTSDVQEKLWHLQHPEKPVQKP